MVSQRKGRKFERWASSVNIADELDGELLSTIGRKVVEEYEIDEQSRSEWLESTDEAMKLAMQVAGEKNYPWPKAANIKFPLLTTAAMQFAARAYPAIIQNRNVVRAVVNGNDEGVPAQQGMPQGQPMQQEGQQQWLIEPGVKQARADRISHHMSWQLLEEQPEWEEETDKLLHILPIVGCSFRKSWFDPAFGRNRSELVTADRCVVNYWAKSLDTAPRVTQCFDLYPYEVEERKRMGLYLDRDLPLAQNMDGDEDAPLEFLEQHRFWDLDDDGYPEPYVVVVHKDSATVMRIVARYNLDSIMVNKAGEIAKIEPDQYFTKYDFLPNPEGGFYGVGFGVLLRPLNESVNTTINQMLDAGHLQNTGGGFIGGGLRVMGGNYRFRPGEYKRVTTTAGGIGDNVLPLNFPGPSQALFNLLGLLIEAGRDISSVKDVMTGDEGPANEAATRTLARIEQGMKVFSAIYKRIFRSLKAEYKKLYRLNALYLDDEVYFRLMDSPEAVKRADYNTQDLDVQPAADPNMVSDQQRLARAQFLMEWANDPMVDGLEIRRRVFEAAEVDDVDKLVLPEPPPNPEMMAKADEIEIEKMKVETERQKMIATVAEIKSKVVLNLAKADAESERTEIEAMSKLLDTILEAQNQETDRMRIANERRKIEADERRVRDVEGKSGNGNGAAVSR